MPWVPRDLYDVMLSALRESRGGSVSQERPVAPANAGGLSSAGLATPVAVGAGIVSGSPAVLSSAVQYACAQYAYGDRDEQRANLRAAHDMALNGRSDADIVESIRQGAAFPTWAGV